MRSAATPDLILLLFSERDRDGKGENERTRDELTKNNPSLLLMFSSFFSAV